MGLLDFDDDKILAGRRLPTDRPKWERRKLENNFEDLQLLGHAEQSQDFEDSPHADRGDEWIECPSCGDEVKVPKGQRLCFQCKEENERAEFPL